MMEQPKSRRPRSLWGLLHVFAVALAVVSGSDNVLLPPMAVASQADPSDAPESEFDGVQDYCRIRRHPLAGVALPRRLSTRVETVSDLPGSARSVPTLLSRVANDPSTEHAPLIGLRARSPG